MTRSHLVAVIILLSVLLGGCHPDQARDVRIYRDLLRVPGDDEAVDTNQPLSLQQALLLANSRNEQLSIAGENYLQALIDRKRAVANFLPTADLGADYTLLENSDLAPGTSSHQFDTFALGHINIFSGFSDVADLRQKEAVIIQQKELLLNAQESLLIDVARVYYEVLRAEQSVAVLQNSLKVQEERVRDMQARSKAGVARPLDVYQTEAKASESRVFWLGARNRAATGRALLAFLLNAPIERSELSDQYTIPATVPDLSALQDAAVAGRRDLLAAAAASAAARHQVDVVFGRYYPSVNIDFAALLAQHPTEDPDWTGVISAEMPLFSAGRIEADLQAAWSQFRQAELARQQLARQISQGVEVAFRDFADSKQRLAELQTQVNAATEAFRQAEQSYNIGFATNLERLTAQDQMLAAQLQLSAERL